MRGDEDEDEREKIFFFFFFKKHIKLHKFKKVRNGREMMMMKMEEVG